MIVKIRDYTLTPGSDVDGEFSGHDLYLILKPLLKNGDKILIDLDGVIGYATSFLKGCFGQLSKEFGDSIFDSITFICNDEPDLIEEIKTY